MVALNTAYAAPQNAADLKNRVGDFFYEDHASVGKNRWVKCLNTQEKSCYHYETASGRSNWPNRDPLGERGHELLKRNEYLVLRALALFREVEAELVNEYTNLKNISRFTDVAVFFEAIAEYDRTRDFLIDLAEWVTFLLDGEDDAEFLNESPLIYSFVGNDALNFYDVNGEAVALLIAIPTAAEILKDLAFTVVAVFAVCEAFDDDDYDEYDEYEESPRDKKTREENEENPLKNREKRNEERRDKPKDGEEKEQRQRELEDRKRERGQGGRGDGTKGDN